MVGGEAPEAAVQEAARPEPEGGPKSPAAAGPPEAPARIDIALVFGAPPRDLFGRVVFACVLATALCSRF